MQTTIQSHLEETAAATHTSSRQIEYVDTIQAYDLWAEVSSTSIHTPYKYILHIN